MKVAIIGGGAAGIISAFLLGKKGHDVSIFEKSDILGGHIRTINKNVQEESIGKETVLEGGVIEFSSAFHKFKDLLDGLNIPYEPVDIGTGLFFNNGKSILSSIMIGNNFDGLKRVSEYLKWWRLQIASVRLARILKSKTPESMRDFNMAEMLGNEKNTNVWLKNLMMYSYSMPYKSIDKFPAELALLNLNKYMLKGWFRIKGGVYSYIEKILDLFGGEIYLESDIKRIRRKTGIVEVESGVEAGGIQTFDKVVFATPPDQILKILEDPTKEEKKWFASWGQNKVSVVIHTDSSIYDPYHIHRPSEFDFFEKENDWGYNALLNQVCGIPGDTPYYLSFNLKDFINPEKILKEIEHFTPKYTVEAVRFREEIIRNNGANKTYFAGAWLSDGLHEGAVKSAIRVAELIGDC